MVLKQGLPIALAEKLKENLFLHTHVMCVAQTKNICFVNKVDLLLVHMKSYLQFIFLYYYFNNSGAAKIDC